MWNTTVPPLIIKNPDPGYSSEGEKCGTKLIVEEYCG